MSNYKLKFLIETSDILNKFTPETQKQISEVRFINVKLLDNHNIEIECLALDDSLTDCNCCYNLLSEGEIHLG